MKKTVVLGASPNPARYSFKAVRRLKNKGYNVIPVGFRPGVIDELLIKKGTPHIDNVHTISMYIGEQRQRDFYDYILSLEPTRVIFNPGTINLSLMEKLKQKGIEVVDDCMLVMLDEKRF